jgi:hypothetical protein
MTGPKTGGRSTSPHLYSSFVPNFFSARRGRARALLNLPLEASSYKRVITGILTARKPARMTRNLFTSP